MTARETVSASKKLQLADALRLLKDVKTLHICKGQRVTTLDLKNDKPSRETLAELMLGPTGNLRAPTLKAGKTLIVGFNAEVYRDTLL